MNKFILCVLDRDNKTKKELEINAVAAVDAVSDAVSDAVADAAYYADAAAYYADAAYDDIINHLLHEYFEATGESREGYEKSIKGRQ